MICNAMVLSNSVSRESPEAISTAWASRSRAASARPASSAKCSAILAQASSNALPMVFSVSGPNVQPARIVADLIPFSMPIQGFGIWTEVVLMDPVELFNPHVSTLAYDEITDLFDWLVGTSLTRHRTFQ